MGSYISMYKSLIRIQSEKNVYNFNKVQNKAIPFLICGGIRPNETQKLNYVFA